MLRYNIGLSPFAKRYTYVKPEKKQYFPQAFISCPQMGKGMAAVSDVFDFIGKCTDKFSKIFKK